MGIDHRNVKLTGGFWKRMEDLNRDATVDAVWNRFQETGRIDAFNFDWEEGKPFKPHVFWDSDVVKWLEGACYIIGRGDRPDLKEKIDWLVDRIEKNQGEDGYFNIYFTVCAPDKRFTDRNAHELYCAGHLFEAAVAHFYATGSERLLKVAKKYADHIEKVFVTDKSSAFVTPGHQEIELALVKLYHVTGEERYLNLAKFFIDNRGCHKNDILAPGRETYTQDDAKPAEQTRAMGHAVRCLYMLSGMADCAHLTGDKKLLDACIRLYEDIANSKMYITGGVGSTPYGEAITVPYDLPNDTAYAETCASIALMLFANRMAKICKDAKYADTVERAMYNGMCSGLSLDGQAFFYENPLEIDLRKHQRPSIRSGEEHMPILARKTVFDCSCCPPNLVRILSSMGNFIYDPEEKKCYINQFAESELEAGDIKVTQKTEYPWNGRIEITADNVDELYIRIPSWCESFKLDRDHVMQNGYAVVKNDGNKIVLDMDMGPFAVKCNPKVGGNVGKAAVQYGPVVYCAESSDNCDDLHSLYIDGTENAKVKYDQRFHGNVIELDGLKVIETGGLYTRKQIGFKTEKIKLIPYYAFANRGEASMIVWVNEKQ